MLHMSRLDKITDWAFEARKAKYSVKIVAQNVNVSTRYINRYFHEYLGTSIGQLLHCWRMEEIERLLHSSQEVKQICAAIGWNSVFHLTREFKKHFGIGPAEYRRKIQRLKASSEIRKSNSAFSKAPLLSYSLQFRESLPSPSCIGPK
jgi:AraC-like DNA-binding protein